MNALIDFKEFIIPERFIWLKELANISTKEMLKTFNCGIGLIIIIHDTNKKDVLNFFRRKKTNVHIMGEIIKNNGCENKVSIKNFGEWALT